MVGATGVASLRQHSNNIKCNYMIKNYFRQVKGRDKIRHLIFRHWRGKLRTVNH
ncbi:hypothetical protein HM1_2349 [Heliomicrobium modesticaldum Ice1]|uniref:Uncharacterized protein n=1 Tax=Heliobacterium modesticaldum (strain ATCC 51547 / Ice1) TaxID=498761 RepID=B0THU7_HELMI|nr:hypothetical protein HM1_2349 [Heliomicrobium modesticaldum Ice1]